MRRITRRLSSAICILVAQCFFAQPAVSPAQTGGLAQATLKRQQATGKNPPQAPAGAPALKYSYFFDLAGDYEKIGIAGKEVAHGQLPSAATVVQPFPTSGFEGCVFCGARYDRTSGRLYVVMAKQASGSNDASDNFEVVAVRLPGMEASLRADVSFSEPIVLVSLDGSRLLASYELSSSDKKQDELGFGVSIFSASTLKLLGKIRETTTRDAYLAGYVVNATFSDQAYFSPDGKTIYDHFFQIKFDGQKLSREEVDPVALLVKSVDKSLGPYALVDTQTKAPTFDVTALDSAAGRILVALNVGRDSPQALMIINLENQTFSPPIKVGKAIVPATHLTPDGKQIVIEESEVRHRNGAKPDEPQEALFKTGRLTILDAATSAKPREIAAPEISGFDTHLLCISSNGGAAFFSHDGHLYRVDLPAGTESQVHTQPQFVFDQWTKCVMADR